MGYASIDNLYKNANILMFRECFAMEKIHGTSAHLRMERTPEGDVRFIYYSGGANRDAFVKLFDEAKLKEAFLMDLQLTHIAVYGEAYGGKLQGMSDTYGKTMKFVAFDVQIGERWLNVDSADLLVQKLGLEFVPYARVSTDREVLDAQRDMPSRQAVRNGITEPRISEGVVLRPIVEVTLNNGTRICAKHKRPEFSERASKKDTTVDPGKLEVLRKAEDIALEWVTEGRLKNILSHVPEPHDIEKTPLIIQTMKEDVKREAADEIVWSAEAERAIAKAAAVIYRAWVKSVKV